jgi:hypothetical protein
MTDEPTSRRAVLQSGAALSAVLAAGGLSGCLDSIPFVGGSSALGRTPADSEAVATMDAEAVREADASETLADAYFGAKAESRWYDGPEDYDGALERFEDETGIDPGDVTRLTMYAEYDSGYSSTFNSEYGAVILEADLSEDDLVDAMEDSLDEDYDDDEESGKTVYEPEEEYNSWIGVLEDGVYVLGAEDAVVDSIKATTGDDEGVDDVLRQAYGDTRDGAVRWVSEIPGSQIPDEVPIGQETIDTEALADAESAAGAMYTTGSTLGATVRITPDDGDDAGDIEDSLDELLSAAADSTRGDIGDEFDEVELDTAGGTVTMTYERDVDDVADLIESWVTY